MNYKPSLGSLFMPANSNENPYKGILGFNKLKLLQK